MTGHEPCRPPLSLWRTTPILPPSWPTSFACHLMAEHSSSKSLSPGPERPRSIATGPRAGPPERPDLIEEVPVRACVRRGQAVDLVLDRSREARSQIVFTTVKGREAIF